MPEHDDPCDDFSAIGERMRRDDLEAQLKSARAKLFDLETQPRHYAGTSQWLTRRDAAKADVARLLEQLNA